MKQGEKKKKKKGIQFLRKKRRGRKIKESTADIIVLDRMQHMEFWKPCTNSKEMKVDLLTYLSGWTFG